MLQQNNFLGRLRILNLEDLHYVVKLVHHHPDCFLDRLFQVTDELSTCLMSLNGQVSSVDNSKDAYRHIPQSSWSVDRGTYLPFHNSILRFQTTLLSHHCIGGIESRGTRLIRDVVH